MHGVADEPRRLAHEEKVAAGVAHEAHGLAHDRWPAAVVGPGLMDTAHEAEQILLRHPAWSDAALILLGCAVGSRVSLSLRGTCRTTADTRIQDRPDERLATCVIVRSTVATLWGTVPEHPENSVGRDNARHDNLKIPADGTTHRPERGSCPARFV